MGREKFDNSLRSVILKHEEEYIPSFDRKKVRGKSLGNKTVRNLAAVVSVAAIVLFALNFLLPGDVKEDTLKGKTDINTTALIKGGPDKVKEEKLIPAQIKKVPVKIIPQMVSKAPVIIQEESVTREIESTSVFPPNQTVVENNAIQVQNVSPDLVAEEIKVTFKRGKPAVPKPDIEIVFLRGVKLKPGPREKHLPDSTSYVNIAKPFRLIFKP